MKTKTPKLKIDQPEVPKTPLRLLADALRPYKVTDMEVDFAGCGDSGDINDIRFYKLKSDKRAMSGISPSEINYQDIPSDLRDEARKIANTIITKLSGDWWNNDGGYGAVEVDFVNGKVSLEGNYYEMRVSETETLEMDLDLKHHE
jgi:hypothetical protein